MTNYDIVELTKRSIEEFCRKSILVILNSRIEKENSVKEKQKINSSFGIEESEINELDDVFSEDYAELQSFPKNYNTYILEIFYQKKDFNILIEKYTFQYFHDDEISFNEAFLNKKLKTMLRSIYCISRFLPGYSFFGKKGYSYSLHYRLFSNLKSQKNFEKKKTSTIKISNASLMNLGINIEYLTKEDIKQLEDEHNKKEFEKLIFKHHRERPRCLSLTSNQNIFNNPFYEVLNFGDNSQNIINENYFSDKHTKTNMNYSSNDNNYNNLSQIKPNVNFDFSFQSDVENNNYSFETYSHLDIDIGDEIGKNNLLNEATNNITKNNIINCQNNNSSSIKKIMKTSDTTSSFSSDNSFELEIENENEEEIFPKHKTLENFQNSQNFVKNGKNSGENEKIEKIFKNFKNLKKNMKSSKLEPKINLYKLSELYSLVINKS